MTWVGSFKSLQSVLGQIDFTEASQTYLINGDLDEGRSCQT